MARGALKEKERPTLSRKERETRHACTNSLHSRQSRPIGKLEPGLEISAAYAELLANGVSGARTRGDASMIQTMSAQRKIHH